MNTVTQTFDNGTWTILLSGRIDSGNAPAVEQALKAEGETVSRIVVDAKDLDYISSAGLRILLRLRKGCADMQVLNVSPEVYEVFEMTGFTEMMTVQKAFRQVSIEGCDPIGKGSNGIVYRIDPDTIVKVYYNKDALPEIQHEREVARKALILGIPTALSYDVVQVGDHYGSVFELLNATSLSKAIKANPEDFSAVAATYVEMMKEIHSIEVAPGTFPNVKETALHWAEYLESYLPADTYQKLLSLIQAVPEDNHLIHGDYHTNNLMQQNGETLIIDMDTLSQGHPVFEFGTMFLAYKGFHMANPKNCEDFLGYTAETAYRFWRETLALYLGTRDEEVIQRFEDKCSIIGYTRMMRRTIRRIGFDNPEGKTLIDICKENLILLCDTYDTLL